MKGKRIGICLAVLALVVGAALLIRAEVIRRNMLPYTVAVSSAREGSAPGKMSYGFWAMGDAITARAFVYDMEHETRCEGYELPVQPMDEATRKQHAQNNPNVRSEVGWLAEKNGEIDMSGLPDGSYGVAMDVYREGECVETVISAHAYRYQADQPEAAKGEEWPPDVQVNADGLYAAHMDDWGGMTFRLGEGFIVPVTGYLITDEACTLRAVSLELDGEAQLGEIPLESIRWDDARASAAASRERMESEYGTTIGTAYQGGFAYALPYSVLEDLEEGAHRVGLTLTLGEEDDGQYVFLNAVFHLSSQDGVKVEDIEQFMLEHCS